MKRLLHVFSLLVLLCAFGLSAHAAIRTGKLGDKVNYEFDTTTGELHIYGTGDMYNYFGEWKNYPYTGSTPLQSIRTQIKSVVIDEGVTSIGAAVFYNCTALTDVSMPASLKLINYEAFRKCTALKEITIGSGVTQVMERSLTDCNNLEVIRVAEGNTTYTTFNDVLFTIDMKTIVRFPAGMKKIDYVIPEGVIRSETDALYKLISVQQVTIPTTMTHIDYGSFDNSPKLTTLVFKSEVPPTFGKKDLAGLNGLVNIYVPCGSEQAYKNSSSWAGFNTRSVSGAVLVDFFVYTNDINLGDVEKTQQADCTTREFVITAIPTSNGQFKEWQDGVTDNPRTIKVPSTSAGKIEYTAFFEPREFTVTLQKQKGWYMGYDYFQLSIKADGQSEKKTTGVTEKVSAKYHYGDVVTLYCDVVRQGCKFTRWSDGNTDNPRTYTVTGDVTIGAYIDRGNVTINTQPSDWNAGSTSPSSKSVSYGTDVEITATANSDYRFSRWDDGDTNAKRTVTATSDKTYTAIFVIKTFKVEVEVNDPEMGEVSGYGTFNSGTKVTLTATAKPGYKFVGWSGDISSSGKTQTINSLRKDYKVVATFEPIQYNIKFLNATGGTLSERMEDYNTMPQVPASPEKAATAEYTYTFTDWSPKVAVVTGPATYTPQYSSKKNEYTVTFVDGDGKILQTSTLEYGATPVYNGATPTKTATAQFTYTYKSWDKTIAAVTGNTTYTATFESVVNKYLVKFVDYDGVTVLQSSEIAYGNTPKPPVAPTREATDEHTYKFSTWSPTITAVTSPATYTATYTESPRLYTITFKNDDGTLLETKEVAWDVVPEYTGATPTKAQTVESVFEFDGWTTEIVAVNGPASYVAKYKSSPRPYNVVFKNYDGAVLQNTKGLYGTMPSYTGSTPQRAADAKNKYTFVGWSPDISVIKGDVVYTAQFSTADVLYEIKFVNWDNTELAVKNCAYGVMPEYNGTPTREADKQYTYEFDSWTPSITKVLGAATYKAVYKSKLRSYVIKFVSDGKVISSSSYDYGTKPVAPVATKSATAEYTYEFSRWDPAIVSVSGEATYTAIFSQKKNSYTVTFKDGDGTVISSKKYEYGSQPVVPTATKKPTEGYTYEFTGWDKVITKVTGDVTYTAQFEAVINEYTATFVNEDGTVLYTGKYKHGETPTYTGTPTKEGNAKYTYKFSGWNPKVEPLKGNETYVAQYTSEINQYEILFVDENGTTTLQSSKWAYDTKPEYKGKTPVKAKTPEYTYTFSGWTPEVVNVTGKATYTAQYSESRNKYTITYLNYDGSKLEELVIEYGEYPAWSVFPTRESDKEFNYIFAGWDHKVETVSGDDTYTAVFRQETRLYKISFVNWNNDLLEEKDVLYNTIPSYTGETPTKEASDQYSYEFKGWTPDLTYVKGEATYKAEFIPITRQYTVTYVDYDGKKLFDQTYKYGETATTDYVPTRAKDETYIYTFSKWDPENVVVKGDVTIKAVYDSELRLYDIKFVMDNGETISSSKLPYGGTVTEPATPVKESIPQYSYEFAGWTPAVKKTVSDNATYKATFKATTRKYYVTFVDYDDKVIKSAEYEWGVMPSCDDPSRAADAQYTYTFAGWDKSIVTVTGPATYKATYSKVTNKYHIIFKDEDGKVLDEKDVEYDVLPRCSVTPTKNATAQYTYTFGGWSPEVVAVRKNAEYTATYTSTVNSYEIKFVDEDGSLIKSYTLPYGETPVYGGETPTKTGNKQYSYTFDKWEPSIVSVEKDATYKARYNQTVNKYTVTFKNYNDEVLESKDWDYGATPVCSVTPTQTGDAQYTFTFDGWDKDVEEVSAPATYKATFVRTTNSYKITFVNYNNTVLQESMVEYGSIPVYDGAKPIKPSDVHYNYTFKQWSPNLVSVTGEATYTATYSTADQVYTVTFVDYDDKKLFELQFEYDDDFVCSVVPTREPTVDHTYTFASWTPAIDKVQSDAQVKATYNEHVRMYNVRFVMDDGSLIKNESLAYGSKVTPPADPKKDSDAQYSYSFKGWSEKIKDVDSDITYKATFNETLRSYTITFVDYDDSVIKSTEYDYGTRPSCDAPERSADAQYSYSFTGWDKVIVDVVESTTYKAEYSSIVNKYTITFKSDDGEFIDQQSLEYGATPVCSVTPSKKADDQNTYMFKEWTPAIVSVIGDANYTAVFDAATNFYDISFVDEDGTLLESMNLAYGVTPQYSGVTPTKQSTVDKTFSFDGWSPTVEAVNGKAVYTATYKSADRLYNIVFKNADESVIESKDWAYGSTPQCSVEPTKEPDAQYSYSFSGWDRDIESVTGNATYTAQYESTVNHYTIKFVNYDGSVLYETDAVYGQIVEYVGETPLRPTDDSHVYSFSGWSPIVAAVTGNTTYEASYSSSDHLYRVTFVDYDGSVLLEKDFIYGEEFSCSLIPVREADVVKSYKFTGWYPVLSTVTSNTTVTAQYQETLVKYTIKFLMDDGGLLKQDELVYGSEVTPPADPSKASDVQHTYTFAGWNTPLKNVDGDAEYIAEFEPAVRKYPIKFVDYDGSVIQLTDVEYGTLPNCEEPKREADGKNVYVFSGWDKLIVPVVGEAIYTAQYASSLRKYTVTFSNEDGTILGSKEYSYGDQPSFDMIPTKSATDQYSYTFASWTPELTPVEGDAVYTATYNAIVNSYDIYFVDEDGTVISTINVPFGSMPTYPGETPVKESTKQYSYSFDGWIPAITPVVGEATYVASYSSTVNEYTITFLDADGNVVESNKWAYGTTPVCNTTPTKKGDAQYSFSFIGWDKYIEMVEEDTYYIAQFEAVVNKYKIQFVNYEGSVLAEMDVEYGEIPVYSGAKPERPSTETETYTFLGWTPSITEVTCDAKYVATYTSSDEVYTITFVDYDGTVLGEKYFEAGSDFASDIVPKRPSTDSHSYKFVGWTPVIEKVTSDATVTAQYEETERLYLVQFVMDNGNVIKSEELAYGAEVVAPENPIKDADAQYSYEFIGWNETVKTTVDGDATYVAQFNNTLRSYTITFVDYDGTVIKSSEYKYGEKPSCDDPSRANEGHVVYSFRGWDTPIVVVTGDATYTATYSEVGASYVITFVNEDGTVIESREYEYGVMPQCTVTPTKASTEMNSYAFAGWSPEVVTVEADATYTATFTTSLRNYFVSFVDEDGTLILRVSMPYGSMPEYTNEMPMRIGEDDEIYVFEGWTPEFVPVTCDAQYRAVYRLGDNMYTVTFKNYDGEVIESKEWKYGATPTCSVVPEKPGDAQYSYSFKGWDRNLEPVTADAVYTAQYATTINKYVVKFLNYDGSALMESEFEYGSTPIFTGDTPVRAPEGDVTYTFVGWTPDIESVVGDAVYTALFSTSSDIYTITFVDYDGTVLHTIGVESGQEIICTFNPMRSDADGYSYTFSGWSPELTEGMLATSDMTFTATYTESVLSYTIRFVMDDGTLIQSDEVEYGTMPTAPSDPEKANTSRYLYSFTGWDKEIRLVDGDETYVATFSAEVRKYKIVFLDYDGTILSEVEYEYGTKPTCEEPTREADAQFTYYFSGWGRPIVPVTETVTYVAEYNAVVNKYKITVLSNDALLGVVTGGGVYEYGTDVTITATAQTDCLFVGWDDGVSEETRVIKVAGNASYTAVFKSKGSSDNPSGSDDPDTPNTPDTPSNPDDPDDPNNPDDPEFVCFRDAPAVALYDWLLMVDKKKMASDGYLIDNENVTWYRVVGEPDDLCGDESQLDDEVVGIGMYYTMENNLIGTGDYYAVVLLGDNRFRTQIFEYSANNKVLVLPNKATSGQTLHVVGLDGVATIKVYDIYGRVVRTVVTDGCPSYDIQAESNVGIYIVKIVDVKEHVVKYLVK